MQNLFHLWRSATLGRLLLSAALCLAVGGELVAQKYAVVIVDVTGSMNTVRASTGNTRCTDAIDQAMSDVSYHFATDPHPDDKVSIWSVGTTPTRHTGFVTESAALVALTILRAGGCSGSTALADTIYDALEYMSAEYPTASWGEKFAYISSDGGENNSVGPMSGPWAASGTVCGAFSPSDSWQAKLCDYLSSSATTLLVRYWDDVVDSVDSGAVPDSTVFDAWARATGGTYTGILDTDPRYPGLDLFRDLPLNYVPAASYSEDFDGLAGVVPEHFGINSLDQQSRLPSQLAWCNIGQSAPCISPFSGSFNLEMGIIPGSTATAEVENSLIIGLDGSGLENLVLDFMAYNTGEETDPEDGVWISDDGSTWNLLYSDWAGLPLFAWTSVAGINLSSNQEVNTDGRFWLRFTQQDNAAYHLLDGVGIDNLTIVGSPTKLRLSASNVIVGQTADISVENGTPGSPVFVAYSLLGTGPTTINVAGCGLVTLDLTSPFQTLPALTVGADGKASLPLSVPQSASGLQLWLQALEPASCEVSEVLEIHIS